MQCGQHAGVGVPELREVEVAGVLAAEDRPRAGHLGLDEGVANSRPNGVPAVLGDDLGDRLGRDQVVDHGRTGVLGQLARGDERGEHRRADDLAALVDDEAAVGVAVEGQPDVGAELDDLRLQVRRVGRVDRVRLVVREAAVELEVQRRHLERQALEDGRHGVPAHAVARVNNDRERPDVLDAGDELLHVRGVSGQQVLLADRAGLAVVGGQPLVEVALGVGAQLREAGVLADRLGARQAQLDAVVARRVVAGGEHRARHVQRAGGVVEQVGGPQPRLDDVDALARGALGEGPAQLDAGLPHVPRGDDAGAAGEAGEGGTERAGDVGVQLARAEPADVIGLDDGREVAGHAPTLGAGARAPACASAPCRGPRRCRARGRPASTTWTRRRGRS